MRRTTIQAANIIAMLLGETDTGFGAPSPLPGHVEDRIASMGGAPAPSRRRLRRRRVT
jgi:hypothetical protein